MTESVRSSPKSLFAILVAAPIAWGLFDFVAFSLGTLPITPGKIEISGNARLTDETIRTEIYRKLRASGADNLVGVDVTEMSEFLLKHIPALRSAVVAKNIGRGNMTVVVSERTAIAGIQTRTERLKVDREGMLYRVPDLAAADAQLPDVSGLSAVSIASGRNLSENRSGAGLLRLLASMPASFSPQLKSVRIVSPEYFELTFAGGNLVKADPTTFPAKVESLGRTLRSLQVRPAARAVQYIDVRFSQDVIAYAQEERPVRTAAAGGTLPKSSTASSSPRTARGSTQGR